MIYERRQKEVGLTKRVVETLTKDINGRYHVIYIDKFYTSVELALSLLNQKTYVCGSFNIGRKRWPEDLKAKNSMKRKDDKIKGLARGDSMARQTTDGKLVACVWKDKALVYNLNTCFNATVNSEVDVVQRKVRNESSGKWDKVKLTCPPPIIQFNKHMGGVDRHDHLRSSFTCQRQSVRWWHYFLWFSVDMALNNAFIIYKQDNPKAEHKKFQLNVSFNFYNLCLFYQQSHTFTHSVAKKVNL